jgi:hypothetical protein
MISNFVGSAEKIRPNYILGDHVISNFFVEGSETKIYSLIVFKTYQNFIISILG